MSQANQQQPSPSVPASHIDLWVDTHPGKVREANEDNVYPRAGASRGPIRLDPAKLAAKGQLVIVADGVGGAQAGARISERAVQYVSDGYYDGQAPDVATNLRQAVESANHWLHDMILRDPSLSQAATTVTAAVILGNTLTVAHLGDSRAYLIRQETITQLTFDHTLAQEKAAAGRIRPEDIPNDPDHSTLTRSLGVGPHVQVDIRQEQVGPGDVVLLCSDGLYDEVGDQEIMAIAGREAPKKAVKRLITLANRRGGHDNISVAVMRIQGGAAAAGGLLTWQWAALIALAVGVAVMILALAGVVGYRLLGGTPSPETTTATTEVVTLTMTAATEVGTLATTPLTGQPAQTTVPPPPATTAPPEATGSPRSPTSTPLSTSTELPGATPQPTGTPRPGSTPSPPPSPTSPPAPGHPLAPILWKPDPDAELYGERKFEWQWPHPALAEGQAFDLLIWSEAEDQEHQGKRARGVIEPTQETWAVVDLDLVEAISGHEGTYYWTVIVVQKQPYRRIGKWGEKRILVYKPPGGRPPPEKTQDPCQGFDCTKRCCYGASHPLCSQCCSGFVCPPE